MAKEKLLFTTHINAPCEHVWEILWSDASYREWAAVFYPGSHAVSDWQEGSKILFLSPSGDGMTSRIAKLTPNAFMSFEHLGEVKNGVEDFALAEEKGWAGAHENYTLVPEGNTTQLSVELDIDDTYSDYFQETFPKALSKVKALSEQ